MTLLTKNASTRAATAVAVLALGTMGFAGTAQAATGAITRPSSVAPADRHAGPPPPRRFHQRFRSQAECIAFAQRDHNPRTNGWDCRQGKDHNQPWEYWD